MDAGQQEQQLALPHSGVCAGLLQCLSAKDGLAAGGSRGSGPGGPFGRGSGGGGAVSGAERSYIVPAGLKAAIDARSAAFAGTFQQASRGGHELLRWLLNDSSVCS